MLYAIILTIILLWAFGLLTTYTITGLVQVLLIIAMMVVLFRLISKIRSSRLQAGNRSKNRN